MTKIDFKNVQTMIGTDAEIGGDITLDGGVIVYGTVNGSISTKGPVRIAQSGKVIGNISASDVRIGGFVSGNVTVQDKAILGEFSRLQGDLVYRQLLIEEGAQFEGRCHLLSENDPEPLEPEETPASQKSVEEKDPELF